MDDHLHPMTPQPAPQHRAYRLTAIDFLRGLAIVVMAIDHVRDYFMANTSPDPMADPDITPGLFATRWITHFCAPVFILLAGASAGLSASRKSPAELTRFLLARGLWLIFVEMVIISTAWSFAPQGLEEIGGLIPITLQVIWAIGVAMIVLAGAQWLGRDACAALGTAIVIGHNLLDPIWPASHLLDQQWPFWVALHSSMSMHVGPFLFFFRYPLIPWLGVMLLGYGISGVFELSPARRNAILLRAGTAMTLGFVLLRATHFYGDPNPWQVQLGGLTATVMDFLNVTKYPPSCLYLLMTLGPAAILCSFADRLTGPIKDTLIMFGRAPFAFYVAHVYLIHALNVLLGLTQGFSAHQMVASFDFPNGYGVGLPGVYLVWAIVMALLYPLCRWVVDVKSRRRDWWISYL